MALRDGVHAVTAEDEAAILDVWEAAVRATHHFLAASDLDFFRPLVLPGLRALPHLLCARDDAGALVGFVGVEGDRMEALFVHPAWHGHGVGGRLARHAIAALGAVAVDVNEQNADAVAFYRHLGFAVTGRSALDPQGRPFPLLHMRLAGQSAVEAPCGIYRDTP